MSEETDVKLRCLQIAAEASSRVGQYSSVDVVAKAMSFYEWVRSSSSTEKQNTDNGHRSSEASKRKA